MFCTVQTISDIMTSQLGSYLCEKWRVILLHIMFPLLLAVKPFFRRDFDKIWTQNSVDVYGKSGRPCVL